MGRFFARRPMGQRSQGSMFPLLARWRASLPCGTRTSSAAPRPRPHRARQALEAVAQTAEWNTADHPSSQELFSYLKEHAVKEGSGRRGPRRRTKGSVEDGFFGRHTNADGDLSDPLYPTRPDGTTCRRRGMEGRQTHGLDRHSATERRAATAGRGVPACRRQGPRHRSRHRRRLRRQAYRRDSH